MKTIELLTKMWTDNSNVKMQPNKENNMPRIEQESHAINFQIQTIIAPLPT